jgi:hypothetical protein
MTQEARERQWKERKRNRTNNKGGTQPHVLSCSWVFHASHFISPNHPDVASLNQLGYSRTLRQYADCRLTTTDLPACYSCMPPAHALLCAPLDMHGRRCGDLPTCVSGRAADSRSGRFTRGRYKEARHLHWQGQTSDPTCCVEAIAKRNQHALIRLKCWMTGVTAYAHGDR